MVYLVTAIRKRGLAHLCKVMDYAVVHTAVTGENGFLLKKRERLGEWDDVGDEGFQQSLSSIQRLGVVRLIEAAVEKICEKKSKCTIESCPMQGSHWWFQICKIEDWSVISLCLTMNTAPSADQVGSYCSKFCEPLPLPCTAVIQRVWCLANPGLMHKYPEELKFEFCLMVAWSHTRSWKRYKPGNSKTKKLSVKCSSTNMSN